MQSQSLTAISTDVAILRDGEYFPFNVGDQLSNGDMLINNTNGPLKISSLLNPVGDGFEVVSLEAGGSAKVLHRGEDHVDLVPVDGASLALTDEIEADAADVVIHDESSMMGLMGGGAGLASGLLAAGGLVALAALGADSDDGPSTALVEATPEEQPNEPVVTPNPPTTAPPNPNPPTTAGTAEDLTGVAGLLSDTSAVLDSSLSDVPLLGQLINGVDGLLTGGEDGGIGGDMLGGGLGDAGLSGALAGLGDQLSAATGDIPVVGGLLGALGGVVGGVTEAPLDSVGSTGVTALLEDTGAELNGAFTDTPLLGELTDVLGDVVGAGTGELLPTEGGLANVTDTLGSALNAAPADVPLVSDLSGLLGGVVGQLGDTSVGANSPTFDAFPDLLNLDSSGVLPDIPSLLGLG